MKRVSMKVTCSLPSWHYCNYDGFTANGRFSKELCKFCKKTKAGYKCVLHDQPLTSDPTLVHKCKGCIDVCGRVTDEVVEAQQPPVDVQALVRDTLKSYNKLRMQLVAQGYPASIVDDVATRYMLNEK